MRRRRQPDTTGRIFCAPLSAASGRRRMHGRPVGSPETPGKPMRRIFLRGVMAVTEAGVTLTKTVSQHCDGGDDVPTYSIDHRKHGLRLGDLPWFHDRRVRTPRPGPKRPTRTRSRLPGPPSLPKGRGGLARSDPLHDLGVVRSRRHSDTRGVHQYGTAWLISDIASPKSVPDPGCSLTRGWKSSSPLMHLPGSLFSPQ